VLLIFPLPETLIVHVWRDTIGGQTIRAMGLTFLSDSIFKVRREVIESMSYALHAPLDELDKFFQGSLDFETDCSIHNCSYEETYECALQTYNNIGNSLSRCNLWPKRFSENVKTDLRTWIDFKVMKINCWGYSDSKVDHIHCCIPDLEEKIEKVLDEMRSPMLKEHKVHMKAAKRKLRSEN